MTLPNCTIKAKLAGSRGDLASYRGAFAWQLAASRVLLGNGLGRKHRLSVDEKASGNSMAIFAFFDEGWPVFKHLVFMCLGVSNCGPWSLGE